MSHARRIALTLAAATGTVVGGGLAVHASGVAGTDTSPITDPAATAQPSIDDPDKQTLTALSALEDELRRRLEEAQRSDGGGVQRPTVARADGGTAPPAAHVATGASGALDDDDGDDDEDSDSDDDTTGAASTRSRETPSTVSRDTGTHDGGRDA